MKRPFLTLIVLLSCVLGRATPSTPDLPQNVLFILADDLGWMDLGFQGNRRIETPNLDRLAAQGMVFSQAYGYPLCTPSRAAFMTGKHPARLKMTRVFSEFDRGETPKPPSSHPANRQKPGGWDELSVAINPDLPLEEITLGELAKAAKYHTAFMGKWHLGFDRYYPEHQGFDTVFCGDHWSNYFAPYQGKRSPQDSPIGEHIGDRLATEAIDFIKANKTKPFFLCTWFYDVHTPIEAKKELVEYYAKKLGDDPTLHPVYAAMVHTLDENVGRILKALDDEGLTEKTLVIFGSDNGGVTNTGSEVFDPREFLNRHPRNSAFDLAHCKNNVSQTFVSPGAPFVLTYFPNAGGHYDGPALTAEILEQLEDGSWSALATNTFKPGGARSKAGPELRVDRVPAAGRSLMLRLTKPRDLSEDTLTLAATRDDSYEKGALMVDGQPEEGDLVVRVEKLPLTRGQTTLTSNAPLRGQKIELYEGGIRIPLTVRWPGIVQPGSRCDTPVVAMDLFPTLGAVWGQPLPPSIDGTSLLPLLTGSGTVEREALYWHYPHYMFQQGGVAIREGDYKLIQFYVDGRVELYDLAKDLSEQNNLAAAMPERVQALLEKIRTWQIEVGASLPKRLKK